MSQSVRNPTMVLVFRDLFGRGRYGAVELFAEKSAEAPVSAAALAAKGAPPPLSISHCNLEPHLGHVKEENTRNRRSLYWQRVKPNCLLLSCTYSAHLLKMEKEN